MATDIMDIIAEASQVAVLPPKGEVSSSINPAFGHSVGFTVVTGSTLTAWLPSEARQATTEELASQIRDLATQIGRLEANVLRLCELTVYSEKPTAILPINTLIPGKLEVRKVIYAVVRQEDGAYVASFPDANINASGDTELDAYEMLKDMICATYRLFTRKEDVLGDEMRKQFDVLKEFICETA